MLRGSNVYNLAEHPFWQRLCEHRTIDNHITAAERESEISQMRPFIKQLNDHNDSMIEIQQHRIARIKRVIAEQKNILHRASKLLTKDQLAIVVEYLSILKKLLPLEDNIALAQDLGRSLSIAKFAYSIKVVEISVAMRKEYEAGQACSEAHTVAMAELDKSLMDPHSWQDVVVSKLMRYSQEAADKLGNTDAILDAIEGLMA